MNLVIERDSVQKILNYLGSRPFAEVYEIVPLLTKLPEVNIVPSASAPATTPEQPPTTN